MSQSPKSSGRRVVIVDDDEVLRVALDSVLTRAGWTVVGQATNGREAVAVALAKRPDVVLMDLSMPVMDGIEATREIRVAAPDIAVIVLTVTADATVFDALKAGAVGYLVKGRPLQEIVDGIEIAAAGGSPLSPRVARMVLEEFTRRGDHHPKHRPTVSLSPREHEILRLLVDGHTAAAVADRLCISVHTANAHVRNIYAKLEVTSRAQVVARALHEGLV